MKRLLDSPDSEGCNATDETLRLCILQHATYICLSSTSRPTRFRSPVASIADSYYIYRKKVGPWPLFRVGLGSWAKHIIDPSAIPWNGLDKDNYDIISTFKVIIKIIRGIRNILDSWDRYY